MSSKLEIVDTGPKYDEQFRIVTNVREMQDINGFYFTEGWTLKSMVPWGENVLVCLSRTTINGKTV